MLSNAGGVLALQDCNFSFSDGFIAFGFFGFWFACFFVFFFSVLPFYKETINRHYIPKVSHTL